MTTQTDSDIRCVALTGGTGSFGQAFTRYLLANTDTRIRIISRDEDKQETMKRELPDSRLTFILGDVRDYGKLCTAFDGADAVVHAAALKRVGTGETQADELIKTNIDGTVNVIDAAISARVPRSLFISTDKAVQSINEYGKSKAAAEGQFIISANIRGTSRHARFSVVRGGNVWNSRGSVLEVWRAALARGEQITVHDLHATRFCLPMPIWTAFCWRALCSMRGGEIFVPVLRAWRLGVLAEAMLREYDAPLDWKPVGARDGDKQHEWLIGPHEVQRTIEVDERTYIIEPPDKCQQWNYVPWPGRKADPHMRYTSENVSHMSMDELRELIHNCHKGEKR